MKLIFSATKCDKADGAVKAIKNHAGLVALLVSNLNDLNKSYIEYTEKNLKLQLDYCDLAREIRTALKELLKRSVARSDGEN